MVSGLGFTNHMSCLGFLDFNANSESGKSFFVFAKPEMLVELI